VGALPLIVLSPSSVSDIQLRYILFILSIHAKYFNANKHIRPHSTNYRMLRLRGSLFRWTNIMIVVPHRILKILFSRMPQIRVLAFTRSEKYRSAHHLISAVQVYFAHP
jgi:hypothetical protein